MSDTRTARELVSDGSGKPPGPAAKRAGSIARAWRYDSQIEHLIAHPELLDKLAPRTASTFRMSIGSYTSAKQIARDLGLDVSGG